MQFVVWRPAPTEHIVALRHVLTDTVNGFVRVLLGDCVAAIPQGIHFIIMTRLGNKRNDISCSRMLRMQTHPWKLERLAYYWAALYIHTYEILAWNDWCLSKYWSRSRETKKSAQRTKDWKIVKKRENHGTNLSTYNKIQVICMIHMMENTHICDWKNASSSNMRAQ